jgi:hypothetical protein
MGAKEETTPQPRRLLLSLLDEKSATCTNISVRIIQVLTHNSAPFVSVDHAVMGQKLFFSRSIKKKNRRFYC